MSSSNTKSSSYYLNVLSWLFAFLVTGISIWIEWDSNINWKDNLIKEGPKAAIPGIVAFLIMQIVRIYEVLKSIKAEANVHKGDLIKWLALNSEDLTSHLSLLSDKIDLQRLRIEEQHQWKEQTRAWYLKILKDVTPVTSDRFNAMFCGEFIFSSDIFKFYYMPLLYDPDVTFYFSSAIVYSTDYFIENNIEELRDEYVKIAESGTDIEIHFILNNHRDMDKSAISSLEKSYDDLERLVSTTKKIKIFKGYTSQFNGLPHEQWKKDFGIAGDLACAEMSQTQYTERYKLYFTPSKLKELNTVFTNQRNILKI